MVVDWTLAHAFERIVRVGHDKICKEQNNGDESKAGRAGQPMMERIYEYQ